MLARSRKARPANRGSRSACPRSRPDWLADHDRHHADGTTRERSSPAIRARVWAVNLGCLGSTCGRITPTIPSTPTSCASISIRRRASVFEQVREAAGEVKALLDEDGIAAHPKTTGNRGCTSTGASNPDGRPIDGAPVAAVAVARRARRRRPDLITDGVVEGGARRAGASSTSTRTPWHKTVFGAWSVRRRAGGQVSTPCSWRRLPA